MLGKTVDFTKLLNSKRNGLIIKNPHIPDILTEISSYPSALFVSKVRIIFVLLSCLISSVLKPLVVSNNRVNRRVI